VNISTGLSRYSLEVATDPTDPHRNPPNLRSLPAVLLHPLPALDCTCAHTSAARPSRRALNGGDTNAAVTTNPNAGAATGWSVADGSWI
jgi:hypothetical protein